MAEKTRKRVSIVEINRKYSEAYPTAIDVPLDASTGPKFGCRHVQAILLCLALVFGIGTRTNLSVAIVAMTDNTTSPNPNVPAYDWKNTSVILSSFFWSYLSLQILAGYLGKTYGPKYFLLAAYFINCCACASIPIAASTLGSGGVILCRIIQGLSQGFIYPSIHVMLGMWVPNEERTTLNNFVFSGVAIGSLYASILTGYISASWLGWEYSFYLLAIMGALWCVLWLVLGQNSPASHPLISAEEKRYIQFSLKQEEDVNLPIPWKKIFSCVPFYALMIAGMGNTWGYATMMTETPTYLANVMNFDVKSNALVTGIPTILNLVCSLAIGPLSDWLVGKKYLSVLNARRIFHLIGSYGQAACQLWLSYLTEDQAYMSVLVLSLANGFGAAIMAGSSVNHLDLSPRFSGIMFGALNAIGQVTSIVAPLVAQWVLTDLESIAQWRTVFLTTVGSFVVGGTVFFFLASATRQPWDGPENKTLEERRKKISVISMTAM